MHYLYKIKQYKTIHYCKYVDKTIQHKYTTTYVILKKLFYNLQISVTFFIFFFKLNSMSYSMTLMCLPQFLGNTEVDQPKGTEVVKDAVRKLKVSFTAASDWLNTVGTFISLERIQYLHLPAALDLQYWIILPI